MSNRVHIIPTKFIDVEPHGDGEISYGYRAYDDEVMVYANHWDDIPTDPLEVLKRFKADAGADEQDLLDWAKTNGGIYIGDGWFSYEEVASVLNSYNEEDEEIENV